MESLRQLPSVDQVLRALPPSNGLSHAVLVDEIRTVLAEHRQAPESDAAVDETSIAQSVLLRLGALHQPSLRSVINATGIILHTNLGRAPVPAFTPHTGYSNLEYDLESGKRGQRDVHTAGLLKRLIGQPAILVNNNAAAVFLVLNELAAGHEVIVSRGELIEIGDGFRIPEIMTRSGVVLREVGTTNRTSVNDYRQAIGDKTRLIMRVHPSNFSIRGFTSRPELKALTALGRERNIPVYEDLGSGCLVDLRAQGIVEPLVSDSLAAGVNVLSFSCDKLLGGPQTGIVAGDGELVARIRRNPMYRAFRVDKLIVQALETTLSHLVLQNWQLIPALRMIFASLDRLRERAERLKAALTGLPAGIRQSESPIGGGSTPDQTLPTWVVALHVPDAAQCERRLRMGNTPVVARIERGEIILDMRTVSDDEISALAAAITAATQSDRPQL